MFFVSNKAVEASSRKRENKHLGGKIFKNIVFLYNNIYFCPKMGCVTVFIYIYIILIFYWFSNHFCIFVCVVLSVTELWIQLSASHFCMSASHFRSRILYMWWVFWIWKRSISVWKFPKLKNNPPNTNVGITFPKN